GAILRPALRVGHDEQEGLASFHADLLKGKKRPPSTATRRPGVCSEACSKVCWMMARIKDILRRPAQARCSGCRKIHRSGDPMPPIPPVSRCCRSATLLLSALWAFPAAVLAQEPAPAAADSLRAPMEMLLTQTVVEAEQEFARVAREVGVRDAFLA